MTSVGSTPATSWKSRISLPMALVALTWVVLAANNVLQALEIRELRRAVIMWRRMAQWPAAGVGFRR